MKEDLDKIESWLKNNAEKIIDLSLQKPATESEINELQKLVDKPLPQDFKELYEWHNGLNSDENFGSLFYGLDFSPIEQVISEYTKKKINASSEIYTLDKADPEIDPTDNYNPGWIRFAPLEHYSGLYLDLSPSPAGKYGQIIYIDSENWTGILIANSTAQLVKNFAIDLELGHYHLQEDALDDDNHYLETVDKIDLINWQSSEAWKR